MKCLQLDCMAQLWAGETEAVGGVGGWMGRMPGEAGGGCGSGVETG